MPQARCELAAGAQCSGGNECCDEVTCRPLPTSATCAAGAGICLSGRCLTAATAVALGVQRDTWPGLALAPEACPLRDGCSPLLTRTPTLTLTLTLTTNPNPNYNPNPNPNQVHAASREYRR